MDPDNNLDQFLADTEQEGEADILNQPLGNSEEEEPEVDQEQEDGYDESEEQEFNARNRRERRLMKKLDDERESASFLAGKLEAMSGAKETMEEADYLKSIDRIYGTDSPESQMATDLLKKAITGARDDAEERAYNRMTESQDREQESVRVAEGELETIIDDIENDYGVALTAKQEADCFELMQKMSPKDRNTGEVTSLADPDAVWEVFTERTARSNKGNQAKQLASRSLTGGSSNEPSNLQDDSQQRFLKENGII